MPDLPLHAPRACPACYGDRSILLLDAGLAPVNSCLQLASAESALALPRGRLRLRGCTDCGYVFNADFDLSLTEYSGRYEETQGYSAVFQAFHHQLAASLVERFHLRGRRVLEIGCGKGEFLVLLAELGGNRGIGFDPGHDPGRMPTHDQPIHVVQDFYRGDGREEVDFVCCKMTLEHIAEPLAFLRDLRRGLAEGTGIFFMVPNAGRILAEGAFEDVYYEHCGYFTAASLRGLFEHARFRVDGVDPLYAGQYLGLYGRVDGSRPGPAQRAEAPPTTDVASRFRQRIDHWRRRVDAWRKAGRRIVVWGGGSKAVAFLGQVGELPADLRVVDINPYRQGAYLPGTSLRIEAPVALPTFRPDSVVAMNAIYRDEIADALRALGIQAELLCL